MPDSCPRLRSEQKHQTNKCGVVCQKAFAEAVQECGRWRDCSVVTGCENTVACTENLAPKYSHRQHFDSDVTLQ